MFARTAATVVKIDETGETDSENLREGRALGCR
jgi:hypothetical protein